MQLSGLKDLNPSDSNFFNIFTEDHRVAPVDIIEEVYLKMPTFKIKTDWDAAEPLQKLGVKRVCICCATQHSLSTTQVFSENADLEGISNAPISVSRIEHTSMLEVYSFSWFALASLISPSFPADKGGNRRSCCYSGGGRSLCNRLWKAEGHRR